MQSFARDTIISILQTQNCSGIRRGRNLHLLLLFLPLTSGNQGHWCATYVDCVCNHHMPKQQAEHREKDKLALCHATDLPFGYDLCIQDMLFQTASPSGKKTRALLQNVDTVRGAKPACQKCELWDVHHRTNFRCVHATHKDMRMMPRLQLFCEQATKETCSS